MARSNAYAIGVMMVLEDCKRELVASQARVAALEAETQRLRQLAKIAEFFCCGAYFDDVSYQEHRRSWHSAGDGTL